MRFTSLRLFLHQHLDDLDAIQDALKGIRGQVNGVRARVRVSGAERHPWAGERRACACARVWGGLAVEGGGGEGPLLPLLALPPLRVQAHWL